MLLSWPKMLIFNKVEEVNSNSRLGLQLFEIPITFGSNLHGDMHFWSILSDAKFPSKMLIFSVAKATLEIVLSVC